MNRHRQSTKKNYYSVWKTFNKFFIRLDCKPTSWEKRLILFIGYLVQTKKKSATIRSYISAIKAVLYNSGIKLKLDEALLTALTQACKLRNDRVQTRLPITKDIVNVLLDSVEKVFKSPQSYMVKLYKAMICTAYYGLCRIGEITNSPHVIRACDAYIGTNKSKLMFILHTSKTHGLGNKPQIIKINGFSKKNIKKFQYRKADTPEKYCPFKIISAYATARKPYISDNEQFFVFRDRSPVTAPTFCNLLKKLLLHNKLDPALYCSHAFCAGRSVDLLRMGVSVETIRKIGHWKSSAVYAYLKT